MDPAKAVAAESAAEVVAPVAPPSALIASAQSTALQTGGGAWTAAERERLAQGLDTVAKLVMAPGAMSAEDASGIWDSLADVVGTRSAWETRLLAAEWLLKGGGLDESVSSGIEALPGGEEASTGEASSDLGDALNHVDSNLSGSRFDEDALLDEAEIERQLNSLWPKSPYSPAGGSPGLDSGEKQVQPGPNQSVMDSEEKFYRRQMESEESEGSEESEQEEEEGAEGRWRTTYATPREDSGAATAEQVTLYAAEAGEGERQGEVDELIKELVSVAY
jgi:hypothetical protein